MAAAGILGPDLVQDLSDGRQPNQRSKAQCTSSVGNDICLLCAEKSFQLERKAGRGANRQERRGARLPEHTHTRIT